MRRVLAVAFWSVIAAAFIGPGTVTTCASAGAGFGLALLWALTFSTLACLVLQEAAARVTVVSGMNLGQAIREHAATGLAGVLVLALALGAILLGCAAYEAGNILGAVAGAALIIDVPTSFLAALFGSFAALLLALGTTRTVVQVMSVLVATMGIAFVITAVMLRPPLGKLLGAAFIPSGPEGSGLLVLALIGTTVVPYNIFLGSGIASGQKLSELRFGLAVAIGLGGLISMAIVAVGATVTGAFSYLALADVLASRLGPWAATFFALGLFAAGLSSATTAPLAAAVTAKNLLARRGEDTSWGESSWRYRAVWLGVILVGVFFGATGIQPIPAIIVAQALNGIVLPVAAIFLLLVVNDARIMGTRRLNSAAQNAAMVAVTAVTVLLGSANAVRAAARTAGLAVPGTATIFAVAGAVLLLVAYPVWRAVRQRRAHAVGTV